MWTQAVIFADDFYPLQLSLANARLEVTDEGEDSEPTEAPMGFTEMLVDTSATSANSASLLRRPGPLSQYSSGACNLLQNFCMWAG